MKIEPKAYLNLGELGDDALKLVVKVLLRELHLAHVEAANAADLVVLVHLSGRLPLRLREDNVHELLVRRHHGDALEVVLGRRHCGGCGGLDLGLEIEREGDPRIQKFKNGSKSSSGGEGEVDSTCDRQRQRVEAE